jgi:rhomboid protease GluP
MSQEPEVRPRHPLETEEPEPTPEEPEKPENRIPIVVAEKQAYFTYTLIAINVVIYFVMQTNRNLRDTIYANNWLTGDLALGEFQLQRLLTAMFLHGSAVHLFFNMFSLYNVGRQVERLYGQARFLIIYFLGGLLGSIMSAGIGDYNTASVGASGAILAILAAHLWLLYRNQVFFGERVQQALRFEVIYLGMFLVLGFAPGSVIDNWGHIGGFLGGLLIAYLLPVQLQPVRLKTSNQQSDNQQIVIIDRNRFNLRQMLPQIVMIVAIVCLALSAALLTYNMGLFG